MSGWKPSRAGSPGALDLSKVPTATLLQELGRRCGEPGRAAAGTSTSRPKPFATKALWAKDKADQARAKLEETRALPAVNSEAAAERYQLLVALEEEIEKFDGMSAAFARKGQ